MMTVLNTIWIAIPVALCLIVVYGFTGGFKHWSLQDWYDTNY